MLRIDETLRRPSSFAQLFHTNDSTVQIGLAVTTCIALVYLKIVRGPNDIVMWSFDSLLHHLHNIPSILLGLYSGGMFMTKHYRYHLSSRAPSRPVRPSNRHRGRTTVARDDPVPVQLITKSRPSLAWHDTENQRFVDLSRYPDYYPSDGDSDNSSESNEDDNGSQDGLSEVASDKGDDTEGQADLATPISADEEEHNPAANPSLETTHREDAVSRFLDVVEDHDAHRASVERWRNFLDGASLEQLNQDDGASRDSGCQTVLDDRNFTSRLYRRYKRPLSPAEIYEKLMEKVTVPQPPTSSSSWLTKYIEIPSDVLSKRAQTFDISLDKVDWIQHREENNVSSVSVYIPYGTHYTCFHHTWYSLFSSYASNPDKWLALALIATASPSQAPVLYDFGSKHINHKSSIGVKTEV